jgi:PmbA protein
MEEILALAKKQVEQADVFLATSEEVPVQFEANRLKNILSKQSIILGLRVIKNGRIGYASTTKLTDIQKLVNDAVETAQFGAIAKFEMPNERKYPKVEVFDEAVCKVSLDSMIELGAKMIDAIKKHTPEIVGEAEVSRFSVCVQVMNSSGAEAFYNKTVFGVGLGGTLVRGSDMLFVGESRSSCKPISDTGDIENVVIHQLDMAKNNISVPSRSMPVIFTPMGVGEAFGPALMSAFNGKIVLEGASPVGGKVGSQMFDRRFNLYDDPTIPFQPRSRICDDECVPSQRTALIEEGTVKGFLYDLQTAGMANAKPSGNGSRRGGLVAPSASAYVISTGDTTFEEMVADIKEGLLIEQLMGAEQGNILGGDFSGNVLLGFKIENGKIVGRVKDTMVAGNVYKLLKDIAALGKEAKWVGGMLFAPHIYCNDISVSSKG